MNDIEAQRRRLDTASLTLILIATDGVPRIAYVGPRLPDDVDLAEFDDCNRPDPSPGELDEPDRLTLLPEHGTGFASLPGLALSRHGRAITTQLESTSLTANESLVISSTDPVAEIAVEVTISTAADCDVFILTSAVTNLGASPLGIDWLASATVPVPAAITDVIHFSGRWATEFDARRSEIGAGLRRENRSGRTSHRSFPALVLAQKSTGFERGDALAAHLAWSGNHRLAVERTRDGRAFFMLGALLANGELTLAGGESYQSPPVCLTFAADGLNGIANRLHRYVRTRLCPPRRRPVHFNSWEACYFAQDETTTLELIREAADLGAERFVLDDGWFEDRDDDSAGLGDWQVCPRKYPRGLEPLVTAARSAGMQFGLWIEPEMVSATSDLFRRHPDWILGDGARRQPLGRHQYALNLALPAVQRHVLKSLTELVRRYSLPYLKWDMNRDLTHASVDGRPAARDQVDGFYRLLAAMTERCPDTEIEICSSGGARADYATVALGKRLWMSDAHDPLVRCRVHSGAATFFPPEIMGAHVGSATDEITGRTTSMALRTATALPFHFGIEADPRRLHADERATLSAAIAFHKRHRDWLHQATTWFVDEPDTPPLARLQLCTERRRALLIRCQHDVAPTSQPPPLRLGCLRDDEVWQVSTVSTTDYTLGATRHFSGATLRLAGLPIPAQRAASAAIWLFERQN